MHTLQSICVLAYIEIKSALADQIESKRGRRPKTVRDMRYIFDDQSVDTVSVATPNHWHALAAIWAMQVGRMFMLKSL